MLDDEEAGGYLCVWAAGAGGSWKKVRQSKKNPVLAGLPPSPKIVVWVGQRTPKRWKRLPEDLVEATPCKRIVLDNEGVRATGPESSFSRPDVG